MHLSPQNQRSEFIAIYQLKKSRDYEANENIKTCGDNNAVRQG